MRRGHLTAAAAVSFCLVAIPRRGDNQMVAAFARAGEGSVLVALVQVSVWSPAQAQTATGP